MFIFNKAKWTQFPFPLKSAEWKLRHFWLFNNKCSCLYFVILMLCCFQIQKKPNVPCSVYNYCHEVKTRCNLVHCITICIYIVIHISPHVEWKGRLLIINITISFNELNCFWRIQSRELAAFQQNAKWVDDWDKIGKVALLYANIIKQGTCCVWYNIICLKFRKSSRRKAN